VWLRSADGVNLNAWHVCTDAPRVGTLLFFHGNGGNLSHRAGHVEGMAAQGLDVLLLDYRGYGKSGGVPSERCLYADAEAAYAWLVGERGVSPEEIVLFGESLGAAVATEMATRHDAAALVIESGFTSVREVGKMAYPFLPGFAFDRLGHRYDSLGKLPGIRVPVLVVHGGSDEIIPVEMGRRLFAAANPPKHWMQIEGAGHNDLPEVGGERYLRALGEFARAVTGRGGAKPEER
jgi:pimeloyl-ACP methyl ester carboxylesterase